MTGKIKQPNDPKADPPQQGEDDGSQSGAETFANIEPEDGDTYANIEPDQP